MSLKTVFCAFRSRKSGYDVVAYSSPSLLLVNTSTSDAGILDGQRPQQHRIDQREHRGVDADAETERQDRDGGKSRTAAQATEARSGGRS